LSAPIDVDHYTLTTNDKFSGDSDTELYVEQVNGTLLPKLYNNSSCKNYITRKSGSSGYEYYIANLTNLDGLCEAIRNVYSNCSAYDYISCLLYPYFYSMYIYEPAVKDGETLDEQYVSGKWYAPSVGELSRVIYYRGYSVSGASFNTGDVVRQTIVSSISSGGGVLTTPIFSMALKEAKSNFPTVWSSLVGAVGSTNAGVNNLTTTVNSSINNNYSYQRNEEYDSSLSNYVYKNRWLAATKTSSSWLNTTAIINAWRLTKHQGIPFTKFNYAKS
jgi:hypothetical protein